MEVTAPREGSSLSPARASDAATFGRRHRWYGRMGVIVSVLLSTYIALALNLIIYRHPKRFDLTEEGLFSLSRETKAKLDRVGGEIRVIVAHHSQPGNPQHVSVARVLQRTLDILK